VGPDLDGGLLGSLEYVLEEGPRNDWLQDESILSSLSSASSLLWCSSIAR
jgi:hypothetical protein